MLTPHEGPKVIEFNCRFGDPETQVVIPLLESDLASVMLAAAEGRLDSVDISFKKNLSCATVVVASEGYPGSYPKGKQIKIDAALSNGLLISFLFFYFHSNILYPYIRRHSISCWNKII